MNTNWRAGLGGGAGHRQDDWRKSAKQISFALMPKKVAPKKAKPSQKERFIKFAREVGADDDGKALDRTFKKAVPPAKSKR